MDQTLYEYFSYMSCLSLNKFRFTCVKYKLLSIPCKFPKHGQFFVLQAWLLDWPFAANGRHRSLWPKSTTFLKSQRGYLRPPATTVCCGRRPQHMKTYSGQNF